MLSWQKGGCVGAHATFLACAVAFFLSLGPDSIGVVTSNGGAAGPWKDVLGRPLIAKGLVDTEARDPSVSIVMRRGANGAK